MKTPKTIAIHFLLKTALIVVSLYLIFAYVLIPFRMAGNAMSPYFRDGDLGFFYRLKPPYLNEIVLYTDKDGRKKTGRVIAVPGQTIEFSESGDFLVDGCQPAEEIPYKTSRAQDSHVAFPLTVGQDEYFLLNDFRSIDDDSRTWGCVKKDKILGKMLFLLRRRNF